MADGTSSSTEGHGIHLTSDHDSLLLKIAGCFKNISQVNALAVCLFEGSETGGLAIVEQLDKDSLIRDKAYKVIDEWRSQFLSKAYGRRLYEVLQMTQVNPKAAMDYQRQLCSSDPDGTLVESSQNTTTGVSSPSSSSANTKTMTQKAGIPVSLPVTALWTSSAGTFGAMLDESISSQSGQFDIKQPLEDYFKHVLKTDGQVILLTKAESWPEDTSQLVCISVAIKLDSTWDGEQLKEKLTPCLSGYIRLRASQLQCHKVIPFPFGVRCIYSLPISKAKKLLKTWADSDVDEMEELQECFRDLPSLVTTTRPIADITDTIGSAEWPWDLPAQEHSSPASSSSSSTRNGQPPSSPPAKRSKPLDSTGQAYLGDEKEIGGQEPSAGADNTGMTEEQLAKKLVDNRNPLLPDLAGNNWSFAASWTDIFKKLPVVVSPGNTTETLKLELAYSNPDNVIASIRKKVYSEDGSSNDAECLQRAMNMWLDDKGGNATVKHLFDVLSSIGRLGEAQRFFKVYCKEHTLK